jgi:hypothetical protein
MAGLLLANLKREKQQSFYSEEDDDRFNV